MRAAISLLKIRLIAGFSTSVIPSNVIRLVCQDFINPQRFLHKVSQPSGVFNDFSFNAVLLCRTKLKWQGSKQKILLLHTPLGHFSKVWCTCILNIWKWPQAFCLLHPGITGNVLKCFHTADMRPLQAAQPHISCFCIAAMLQVRDHPEELALVEHHGVPNQLCPFQKTPWKPIDVEWGESHLPPR